MEDRHHQGKWLKRHVERQGISNAEFARRAHMAREALQRLFRLEKLNVRKSTMWNIVAALGVADFVQNRGSVRDSRPDATDVHGKYLEEFWSEHVFKELMHAERFEGLAIGKASPMIPPKKADDVTELDPNIEPYSEVNVPEIPTFDLPIAAGPWMELPEVPEVQSLAVQQDGRFRVYIRGDSMEGKDGYPDGSLVEFQCLRLGFGNMGGSRLEIGKDYYVQRAESATFKKLESFDDEYLVLRAINRRKFPNKIQVLRADVVRMAKAKYILQIKG